MIKEFLTYAIFLTVLLLGVSGHYIFSKKDINSQTQKIAQLTKIVEPSLGVSALENRFLTLDKNLDNTIYPDMPTIDTIGFVYEK